MKDTELRKLIRKEIHNSLNEQHLNEGNIPEEMWVTELKGKTIKQVSVKTNGPDLMLQMSDGSVYTLKKVDALIKWK